MSSHDDVLIQNARLFIALRENVPKEEKHKNIIKCLNNGANVNERFGNDCNNTPLHISVIKEDKDAVSFLLDLGANIDCKNNDDKTPLDIAKELQTVTGRYIVDILQSYNTRSPNKKIIDTTKNQIAKHLTVGKESSLISKFMFKKRPGATGIKGELYETKLLTLLYIRAVINKGINQFYLGSSLEGIGALDDICLRYKQNGVDNVIFLQAKHKNDVTKSKITINELWNATGDFSLPKYFDSYLKIRQKFNMTNDDEMFRGQLEDVKCSFLLYTTIKDDFHDKKNVNMYEVDTTVNELVNSGETSDIFQYNYSEKDIEKMSKTIVLERIKYLGKRLFKFVREGKSTSMMNDEIIGKFHVLLAQSVICVTDVNEDGFRRGSIRPEFLCSNDEFLISLKNCLFSEALFYRKCQENINKNLASVLFDPTPETISKVIGNVVVYNDKNNKLEIKDEKIKNEFTGTNYLSKIEITRTTINEAIEIVGVETLRSGQWSNFKLPAIFGNVDMAVHDRKADKRIKYLGGKIINLLSKSTNKNIVIDQNLIDSDNYLEPGLLNTKGGLGSAVGNLLVFDDSKYLKFNTSEKTLGKNATKLLDILKENVTDLDSFRLKINTENFPELSFDGAECDKKIVKDFLDNLWFYTCQAKENEIEKHIKSDIERYIYKNKTNFKAISDNHVEAIFLKVHNEVQKWWMLEYKNYLTKESYDFNLLLDDFSEKSFLDIINYIFLNKINEYGIQFNGNCINSLCLDEGDLKLTFILTENIILTSIKLVQYYEDTDNILYLDLDYVSLLSPINYEIIINDLSKLKVRTLIVLYKIISKTNIIQLLDILSKSVATKVIVVTGESSIQEIKQHITDSLFMQVKDLKCNLTDLTLESQNKLLKMPVVYQGIEVRFEQIVNEESMPLINSHILNKLINKEKLSIGKSLVQPNYEDIKDYYIERRLCQAKTWTSVSTYIRDEETEYFSSSSTEDGSSSSHSSCEFMPFASNTHKNKIFKVKTLEVLKDNVIILAAPGMGKSTLLTHLSITTKKIKPFIWIERINLLEHTKEFHRWQENNIKIQKLEALKFICDAALSKNRSRFKVQQCEEYDYSLEIETGQLKLKHCNIKNVLDCFALKMFIYCYNKGDAYLLFDGFDEICPHYKTEVAGLLKSLSIRLNCNADERIEPFLDEKQKLWITSRSYNNIKYTLEREFGKSYTLEPFSENDQKIFLEKYFQKKFNIQEFTYNQFLNINDLFEYMKRRINYYTDRSEVQLLKVSSVILRSIYVAAIIYFQSEIKRIHLTADKQIFREKWKLNTSWFLSLDNLFYTFLANVRGINEAMNLSKTPLHMYIALDYFENEINETNYSEAKNFSSKWDLDMNTFAFYERFFETKLKKIRFEEKGQIDIHNPDMKMMYDKEHREFANTHKKLAFYALFKDDMSGLFTEMEIEEIKGTIKRMENAEEKTGLVEYIINGVPKFVHLTFTEYLAVEFITDLLKTSTQEEQSRLWIFILNKIMLRDSRDLMNLLDHKLKIDSVLMNTISSFDLKELIFKELLDQTVDPYPPEAYDDFVGDPTVFTETALDIASIYGFRYLAMILLNAVTDVINKTNLDKFLYIVTECKFFKNAITFGFDEILKQVLDCIRNVDSSRLGDIYVGRMYSRLTRLIDRSNEEIINDLKSQQKSAVFAQYGGQYFD